MILPHTELREFRLKAGLSIRKFADLLSNSLIVHHSTLTNIEVGKRLPGRDLALRIEEVTGISARRWGAVK